MNKAYLYLSISLAIPALCNSFAQDQPISVLDEYVVTASRFIDPLADAPNTVYVLTPGSGESEP